MQRTKLTVIIVLLMICRTSYGQVKDFNKLHHVYEYWKLGGCDTLYYTENVSKEVLDQTINLISSNKTFALYELYNGKETKPLTITSKEQAYLVAELNKLRSLKWPEQLFPSSKRISQRQLASVLAAMQNYNEEKYESCAVVYSFSKPIFFRNKTICLYIDQQIYSKTNSRLFTQFFTQINGKWEEYADVYIHLNEPNTKPDNKLDEMTAKIITAQAHQDSLLHNRLVPETLPEFGKRVFSTFKSQKMEGFWGLFPTQEQRATVLIERRGSPRKTDAEEDLAYHVTSLLQFDNECQRVLDAAKDLHINWEKATYSTTLTSEIKTLVKDKAGNPLTIENVDVEFKDGSKTFHIDLKGVYLMNKVWKTLFVGGLKEITDK